MLIPSLAYRQQLLPFEVGLVCPSIVLRASQSLKGSWHLSAHKALYRPLRAEAGRAHATSSLSLEVRQKSEQAESRYNSSLLGLLNEPARELESADN